MAPLPHSASISEARPPCTRRRKRTIVPLAPGARLVGGSLLVHGDAMTALIRQHATHRRDPADRTRPLRVPNGRGGSRRVPCPGVAHLLSTMVDVLSERPWWSERALADKIGADCHQVHRVLVAAQDDGWLHGARPGDDEGADEVARMGGSHWTMCVPSWIDPAAIDAAQQEAEALRQRGRGAGCTAVIRDREPRNRVQETENHDGSHGPEPERAESAEGSATSHTTQQVDDRDHTQAAAAPEALPDPTAPSAALMAALTVLRQSRRLYAHPAYTRVPRRRDPLQRGLGHTDLLVTDLVVRTTVITDSDTLTVRDLAERTSLSPSSIRSSLRSLDHHRVVDRISRTRWSLGPDPFAALDDVAARLGLHAVRELKRLAHQEQREKYWEGLILHSMTSSDRIRQHIRRMGYEVPEHLVSLRSYEERASDRCRKEVFVLSSARPAPRRRPQTVDLDGRPCLLDLDVLRDRLDMLVVDGVPSGAVTTAVTEEIEELAREQGLSVRCEVPVPVPRLVGRRDGRSRGQRVDLLISSAGKPSLYVEIDRAEKRESRRKLQWAVSQGADALWIRWGGSRDVGVVDDGVRVVEPSWRRGRRVA